MNQQKNPEISYQLKLGIIHNVITDQSAPIAVQQAYGKIAKTLVDEIAKSNGVPLSVVDAAMQSF